MAKIPEFRRRIRDDEFLTGSMDEHDRIRSYEYDTMETVEGYYARNPDMYTPDKIRRIDGTTHNLSDEQKEHAIIHLNSIVTAKALEELRRREFERAQRLNVEHLREPRILVSTGVFFELVESENRGAE
jgi:hypothetical protein